MSTVSIISEVETPQGKKKQKSYTNINPNATNKQLSDFAVKMNTLTDNTYGTTYKIEKTNVDTERDKTVPTLQFWKTDKTEQISEISKQTSGQMQQDMLSIKYNGDGQIFYGFEGINNYMYPISERDNNNFATQVIAIAPNIPAGTDVIFTIKATETTNYQAAEAQLTVHITA